MPFVPSYYGRETCLICKEPSGGKIACSEECMAELKLKVCSLIGQKLIIGTTYVSSVEEVAKILELSPHWVKDIFHEKTSKNVVLKNGYDKVSFQIPRTWNEYLFKNGTEATMTIMPGRKIVIECQELIKKQS